MFPQTVLGPGRSRLAGRYGRCGLAAGRPPWTANKSTPGPGLRPRPHPGRPGWSVPGGRRRCSRSRRAGSASRQHGRAGAARPVRRFRRWWLPKAGRGPTLRGLARVVTASARLGRRQSTRHPILFGCALMIHKPRDSLACLGIDTLSDVPLIIRLIIQTIVLDPSGSVWSRLDRRGIQREQARSVWSRPGRRRASVS